MNSLARQLKQLHSKFFPSETHIPTLSCDNTSSLPANKSKDLIELIPPRWGTQPNQVPDLASSSVTKAWVILDEVAGVIHQGQEQ